MCKPASFVIADNGRRAFWSKLTDSHEDIISEHNLVEMVAGKFTFVRVEIAPDNGILTTPVDQWKFKTDQDMLPDWYDPQEAEVLCRSELPAWLESKVFVSGMHKTYAGQSYAYSNATVKAWGNATVKAWENATVEAGENATVEAGENATVKAWGNATVKAWENATVEAGENATVKAGGNATVEAGENATVEAGENATVEAGENATVKAWGNATVKAWENATVEAGGNATMILWGQKVKKALTGYAVCIDRSNRKPVIHVAGE
jgi:hypothetical protein